MKTLLENQNLKNLAFFKEGLVNIWRYSKNGSCFWMTEILLEMSKLIDVLLLFAAFVGLHCGYCFVDFFDGFELVWAGIRDLHKFQILCEDHRVNHDINRPWCSKNQHLVFIPLNESNRTRTKFIKTSFDQ